MMRVIAGRWGGRKLLVPSRGVRPSTDRVRERLFAVLGPWRGDELIVDLFCGSGALGIEALSRGAARGIFVDSSTLSLEVAAKNLSALAGDGQAAASGNRYYSLARSYAVDFVRRRWPDEDVHCCFLDPPYGDQAGASCLRELGTHARRLGRVLFEGPDEDVEIPAGLREERRLAFGDTRVTLLRGGLGA